MGADTVISNRESVVSVLVGKQYIGGQPSGTRRKDEVALVDNFTKEQLQEIVSNSNSLKAVIRALGYKTGSGSNNITVKKRLLRYKIDTGHFYTKKGIERNDGNIFVQNSTASQATLRKHYLQKSIPYKCSVCGMQPIWNGQPLTLILDHINGVNNDDRLENLRWVCPNCNQQLDTTGFKSHKQKVQTPVVTRQYKCAECGNQISESSFYKNKLCVSCAMKKRHKCQHPDRETLQNLITTKSMVAISKQYGVSDKSVVKWCIKENLPYKRKDIKQMKQNK